MGSSLCPSLVRIGDVDPVLNDRVVDRILHEGATVWYAPQPFEIRFVLGEEKFVRVFATEFVAAKYLMARFDHRRRRFSQNRFASIAAPAPGIAKPNRRQKMQDRRLRSAVGRGCANQN